MDATLAKQARQLNLRNGGPDCPIPPIILMTDDKRMPDPIPAIIGLPRRSMVIFRHYGLNPKDRAHLAYIVRRTCRQYGHLCLIADDLALALRLDADGIHLPEYHIEKRPHIYRQIPQDMFVTSACHSLQTLRKLALLAPDQRPRWCSDLAGFRLPKPSRSTGHDVFDIPSKNCFLLQSWPDPRSPWRHKTRQCRPVKGIGRCIFGRDRVLCYITPSKR